MPTFSYKARGTSGEQVTGTLIADSSLAAARILDEKSLLPVELDELQQERSLLTGGTRKVSISKVGQMYEQLADLLRAGVPILRALEVLSQQSASAALGRVLREVKDDVAGGDSLADAMLKQTHAFPELHASMVRAGEKGGFIEDVLARLSEFVARQDALKNKFIGALIYPCVLMVGALAAVTFIMAWVVPKIRDVLEGQELPLPTRIVFGISDMMSDHGLLLLGGILVIVIALVAFFQSEIGRGMRSRLQLRMVGLGKIYTMVAICRFCRVFGTMLNNGIPLLQALKISKDSTGNAILSDSIEEAAEAVRGGEPLAGPLAASKVFPPAIVDMIAVAEESNSLDKVLVEIANTQEERTARQIDFTMRMLEPLLLMMMGVMIAFIAVALLVPILRMATTGLNT
ncbi:MAG: type II secretion system F family protein [Phycisphaerae bacterium]|nr:type II secretion system F family protein [Phycisphaerae bacterium]